MFKFISNILDKLFPSRVLNRRIKELQKRDPFIYK